MRITAQLYFTAICTQLMRSCDHDLPLEIMDRDPDLLERDSHNKNWTSLLIKKHACIH